MTQAVTELAMSLPFKVDSTGRIAATADQAKIWRDRVKSVIGTAYGQRVYRPNYGCEIVGSIFDGDFDVINEVEDKVSTAFSRHLPALQLTGVTARIEQESRVVLVDIEYTIPQGSSFAAQFGIATINGTAPIVEEVAWQTT